MKTLHTKLILIVATIVLAFSVILLYRTYSLINSNLMQQIHQQVSMALKFEVATREYVAETIRPLMYSLLDEDRFIKQTMSTSYVARSIFEKVRIQFPDYIIKFAAENPRNPVNQAGVEELDMIRYFNENPREQVWSGDITIGGKRYFAKFSAMRMEKACLRCHGDPAEAPAELVEQYGNKTAFFLPMGKIVGLDTIAIPIVKISELMWQETVQNFAVIGGALVLLFITMTLVLRFVVTDRLRTIAEHFTGAARQKEGVRIEPIQRARSGRDQCGHRQLQQPGQQIERFLPPSRGQGAGPHRRTGELQRTAADRNRRADAGPGGPTEDPRPVGGAGPGADPGPGKTQRGAPDRNPGAGAGPK